MSEREEARTCGRCGVTDTTVLDLDTGGAFHPEWRHCVAALKHFLREQDADLSALRQRVRELESAVMGVNEELERERLRLAACGVAARGESRSVNTIYTSDSLKAVVDLYTRADTAERERDEARRALAVLAPMFDLATKEGEGMMAVGLELMRLNKELTEEREAVASFIAQNRALRTRAERAERVVEAARAWVGDDVDAGYKLWEAVRALDAAEGTQGAE